LYSSAIVVRGYFRGNASDSIFKGGVQDVDFRSRLGLKEETATFDPLTACLVLVDEEQGSVADL
jgi:hypothetical protein